MPPPRPRQQPVTWNHGNWVPGTGGQPESVRIEITEDDIRPALDDLRRRLQGRKEPSMPGRKVAITLDDKEQAMLRKFTWHAQPWASIADKLKTALERVTITAGRDSIPNCGACSQRVRLAERADGRLVIWDHNLNSGSRRACSGSGTELYLNQNCSCGNYGTSCTCGAGELAGVIR